MRETLFLFELQFSAATWLREPHHGVDRRLYFRNFTRDDRIWRKVRAKQLT